MMSRLQLFTIFPVWRSVLFAVDFFPLYDGKIFRLEVWFHNREVFLNSVLITIKLSLIRRESVVLLWVFFFLFYKFFADQCRGSACFMFGF
jgi:hypothetical protein